MPPSFAGADAKIGRASEQVDAVNKEIESFFDSHPYGVGGQYDPETATITLYATALGGEIPVVRWSVLIGEIIHNLRSALDHSVWQLALLHLGRPPTAAEAKKIQFPIADMAENFRRHEVRRFLSDDHVQWLDQYQPYKAGGLANHHKLSILRELSNTDKHRVVHPAAVVPEGCDLRFSEASGIVGYESIEIYVGEPLKVDVPMGVVRGVVTDRMDPKVEGEGPIQFGVIFDDPTNPVVHRQHVITTLATLGEVVDGIVGFIVHQFSPSETRKQTTIQSLLASKQE